MNSAKPQIFWPKLIEELRTKSKKLEKTKKTPEKLSEKANGVGFFEPVHPTLS
jgi:hypothetical protein